MALQELVMSVFLVAYPVDDKRQLECLSKNVYFEARGESKKSKLAHSFAISHRANRKGVDYCEVMKPKQDENGRIKKNKCTYSWACDGKKDKIRFAKNNKVNPKEVKSYYDSIHASEKVITGKEKDIIDGADYFYNRKITIRKNHPWTKKFIETARIGDVVFMKEG